MKSSSAIVRALAPSLVLALAVASCATYPGGMPGPLEGATLPHLAQGPVAALAGQATFPERHVQATTTDVKDGATVVLIDSATNQAVVTGVAAASGAFSLNFATGYRPDTTRVYYLEAVKGLSSGQPGANAARVRTLVMYDDTAGAWKSLSAGSVLIDLNTTAIAVGGALKKSSDATVNLAALMGTYSGGTFTDTTVLSASDYTGLQGMVAGLLTFNADPVAGITLSGGVFTRVVATQLVGLDRAYAGINQAVILEGRFPAGAVANVPTGATTTTAVSLVPMGNRAQLTLPADAVSGALTVTGNGATTSSVDLRVAPFEPTMTTFRAWQGRIATPSLQLARQQAASKVIGKYLYVFGGDGGTTVERALVNADGSLGYFSTPLASDTGNPLTLKTGRNGLSAQVIGGYVYLVGGDSSVERAKINANGELSAFAYVSDAAGNGLDIGTGSQGADTAVIGASLYVFGGSGNAKAVRRIPFNVDGTVGAVEVLSQTLNGDRAVARCAVIGNYVYVFGNGASVERARIKPDGTLMTFEYTSPLTTSRSTPSVVTIGNVLYVVGGSDGGTNLSTVEKATLQSDGTLGPFVSVAGTTLATARRGQTGALIGHHYYVIGGYTTASIAGTERVSLNASGGLASTGTSTASTGASLPGGAVVGDRLYRVGGVDGSGVLATVKYYPIRADGSLGALTDAGVSLKVARFTCECLVIGQYLYVVAGTPGGYTNSIERAAINADGSLGAFSEVAFLNEARHKPYVAVFGNRLYVISGGVNGGAVVNQYEWATLDDAGTITSAFTSVQSPTGLIPSYYGAHARIGDNFYILGGTLGGGSYSDAVTRVTESSPGTLVFTSAGTMPMAMSHHKAAVVGNTLYLLGGNAGTTTYKAAIDASGTLGAFGAGGTTLSGNRGDSLVEVTGGYMHLTDGDGVGSTTTESIKLK